MTSVLILAGDTVAVRSIEMSLQVEQFAVKRVPNSDQLIQAFGQEDRVGILMDASAPWPGLSALIRRLRAHAGGRSFRIMLFGTLPAEATPAALQALGISEDEDVFPHPVDMPRLVRRLRDLPAPVAPKEAKKVEMSPLGFPVRGKLAGGALAPVLMAVEAGKGTGTLVLRADHTDASLVFEEGRLVEVRALSGPIGLGALLLKQGRISSEVLTRLSAQGGVHLDALVSSGVVSPHEVPDVARTHGEHVIRWAVTASGGAYTWQAGVLSSNGFAIDIRMARTIIEAIKSEASPKLPPDLADSPVEVDPALEQRLKDEGLQPLELRALHRLKQKQTAQQVVDGVSGEDARRARDVAGFIQALARMAPRRTLSRSNGTVDWAARKDELEQVLKQMEGANPFEVLGVDEGASQSDIRSRFFALSKKYHPDRYHPGGEAIVALAEEIFTRIQEAYDTVGDPQKREAYLKKETGDEGLNPRALIAAEIAFSKASLFLKNRHYTKAREALEEAVSLNPLEPEYQCYLAWASFLENPSNYVESARRLNATLKDHPHIDKGFYFLGSIFKARKEMSQAEAAFKRAVAANPDNVEAKRELRLMALRKEKQGSKAGKGVKGLFNRFRRS